MTKEKVLRILDTHLNKPKDYHFVCHGGGSVCMVDIWHYENTYTCRYQNDKNWLTPLCETCTGLIREEKTLPLSKTMENYLLQEFSNTIIQELENER